MESKLYSPARYRGFSQRLIEQLEPRFLMSATSLPLVPIEDHFDASATQNLDSSVVFVDSTRQEVNVSRQQDRTAESPLALIMVAGGQFNVEQGVWHQLSAGVLGHWQSHPFTSFEWSKVSGPGNVEFSNSQSANSQVRMDSVGDYVLQLTAMANELTVIGQITAQVVEPGVNTINIDQAWLAAQGDGPYYLDQAGTTYRLQTDVTTDGTAFAIIANDVIFDLNGHTITYDDAEPVAIANHSFEVGNGAVAAGWDFSAAPNAERYQGVWLNNETYDGDYSLRFNVPTGNQHVTNSSLITLEANVTYSLSAMFWKGNKPDVVLYVELIGQNGAPSHRMDYEIGNSRGIQFREIVFTTNNSPETFQIRVGIEGAGGADAGQVFVDDIKIQRTRTYGVTVGAFSWATSEFSGIQQFGQADGVTIRNGTIIQGSDGGTWSHNIYARRGFGMRVDNITALVHGPNGSNISYLAGDYAYVTNNHFTSDVKTVTSRDQFHGSMIGNNIVGQISGNTLLNGPHTGIRVGPTAKSLIFDNTIRMMNRYTNGFAINVRGDGTEVYENVIDQGDGGYSGRGIFLSDPTQMPIRVYNNVVTVQQLRNNQEYGGVILGGAYGIQTEATVGSEIFGNTVTVFAREGDGSAFRVNHSVANLHVHHNTFRAVQVNPDFEAQSVKFTDQHGNLGSVFEDNTLISNKNWVGDTHMTTDVVWHRTRFVIEGSVTNARWFESAASANNQGHAIDWLWVDNIYANTAARQAVESGRWWRIGYPQTDRWSAYTVAWSTTIRLMDNGSPIAGALATIRNRLGDVAFTGTTDGNGEVRAVLPQFRSQGVDLHNYEKIEYNGYRVRMQWGGNETDDEFTVDQVQSIVVSP